MEKEEDEKDDIEGKEYTDVEDEKVSLEGGKRCKFCGKHFAQFTG